MKGWIMSGKVGHSLRRHVHSSPVGRTNMMASQAPANSTRPYRAHHHLFKDLEGAVRLVAPLHARDECVVADGVGLQSLQWDLPGAELSNDCRQRLDVFGVNAFYAKVMTAPDTGHVTWHCGSVLRAHWGGRIALSPNTLKPTHPDPPLTHLRHHPVPDLQRAPPVAHALAAADQRADSDHVRLG